MPLERQSEAFGRLAFRPCFLLAARTGKDNSRRSQGLAMHVVARLVSNRQIMTLFETRRVSGTFG
jgi:hypothetical protein